MRFVFRSLLFILSIGLLCVRVLPVAAQTATPALPGGGVVGEFANAAQTFGLLNTIMTVMIIALAVFIVAIFKYVVLPMQKTNQQANQTIATAQASGQANQLQIVTALTQLTGGVGGIATREEATKRTNGAVTTITTHTETAHVETRTLIAEFEKRITALLTSADQAQAAAAQRQGERDQKLDTALAELKRELQATRQVVEKAKGDTSPGDTGPLAPAAAAPPPDTLSPLVESI